MTQRINRPPTITKKPSSLQNANKNPLSQKTIIQVTPNPILIENIQVQPPAVKNLSQSRKNNAKIIDKYIVEKLSEENHAILPPVEKMDTPASDLSTNFIFHYYLNMEHANLNPDTTDLFTLGQLVFKLETRTTLDLGQKLYQSFEQTAIAICKLTGVSNDIFIEHFSTMLTELVTVNKDLQYTPQKPVPEPMWENTPELKEIIDYLKAIYMSVLFS